MKKSKTKDQKPKVLWWNQNIKVAILAKKEALKKLKKKNKQYKQKTFLEKNVFAALMTKLILTYMI